MHKPLSASSIPHKDLAWMFSREPSSVIGNNGLTINWVNGGLYGRFCQLCYNYNKAFGRIFGWNYAYRVDAYRLYLFDRHCAKGLCTKPDSDSAKYYPNPFNGLADAFDESIKATLTRSEEDCHELKNQVTKKLKQYQVAVHTIATLAASTELLCSDAPRSPTTILYSLCECLNFFKSDITFSSSPLPYKILLYELMRIASPSCTTARVFRYAHLAFVAKMKEEFYRPHDFAVSSSDEQGKALSFLESRCPKLDKQANDFQNCLSRMRYSRVMDEFREAPVLHRTLIFLYCQAIVSNGTTAFGQLIPVLGQFCNPPKVEY